MLYFCPKCHNKLSTEYSLVKSRYRLGCRTCPYVHYLNSEGFGSVYHPQLKEVDDIIGGSDTWKNADTTDAQCPKCGFGKAYFMQIQTRSADEPMTTILRCCECANVWRD
ncbi:DNA-directed RNA polymerase III subunit RPC10-like [Artemia franciscana]|uniref:DNA-directed RNA polymerase III subunit RPC10-like n=1 Tax=Artemia franciscana TaxID=6661 RepID=UPI0032DAD97B